ncbi:hypothetical protein ACIBK8_22115 [Streptomyces sp. NPDC050161]|uniref:hypothetical protein n=1 Tax=Streptomyces sp. NPDC050161 TaxID=3365604 RepID=UPI00378B6982
MQTVVTVIVLLALVALGVLFIARVNAQQAGRLATHKYAALLPSFRLRMRKGSRGGAAHPGAHAAGPPPPSPPRRPGSQR